MKRKAQKIVSLALVGTMGVTSFATAALAAPNSVVTGTQVISALNATTDMKGLNRALEEFSRTYGNNIRDVVFDAVGYEEKAETRGIITQGAKAIAKVLRQFGDDIINLVSKVPGVGSALANFLSTHIGPLADFWENASGGVETLIATFLQSAGMSPQAAATAASVIMFVVEIVIALNGLS